MVGAAATPKDEEEEEAPKETPRYSVASEQSRMSVTSTMSRAPQSQEEKLAELTGALEESGQSHLLQFLDELNDVEKASLLAQLAQIKPEATNNLYE